MSEKKLSNFITEIIDADLAADTHGGRVITRFPPEPNGYLHIGHAKAICVNFGLAAQYGGDCHLRFDDTNPTTEDTEYVESIMNDVRWLGFEWTGEVRFASDYFEQMASWAEELIAQGLAYVDFSSIEELRSMRGAVGEPGTPSRYRDTSPEENAEHFRKMRAGEYPDGHCVLRAKIDLSAANILMRDPLLYRIRKEHHHRTGDAWCIYPMYDFAHCLEDAIEGVTHSICTLEFQNNRELYDWVIEHVTLPTYRPRQYEMARLALPNTVMSKRRLIALVQEGHVWGWDDPRMPTLAGIRRRGVPPEAIRQFCDMIGVAKANSTVDWDKFDFALRDTLNTRAERVMAVLDPIKLTLTNVDEPVAIEAELWPHDVPGDATRRLNLGSELLIERSDFAEVPPKGWRRLSPGGEVRLRRGWVVRCDEVIKDADGVVTELRATADLATLGAAPVGRKVRGTIHWLNAADAVPATVRLIEPLFDAPSPGSQPEVDYRDELNPNSLQVLEGAYVEPYAAAEALGSRFQFERCGYFYRDPDDEGVVFNRIVGLRDSWGKAKQAPQPKAPEPKRAPKQAPSAGRAPEVSAALQAEVDAVIARNVRPADALRLCRDRALREQWEESVAAGAEAQDAAKWLLNDLRALRKGDDGAQRLSGVQVAGFLALVSAGRIGRADHGAVLTELMSVGGEPEAVAQALGVLDAREELDLDALVQGVISAHPVEVERFRAGDQRLIGFFVGACMRASKGRADAKALQSVLRSALSG
ncbi:MAG: glutamine--tRNA ligase/YqeY domain fusion protein [Myxococcota bacterium]|nr:glutamine--tRNA ligase/YqeY domain fusion protein [Myxococcota bacterium]